MSSTTPDDILNHARPLLHQQAPEIQPYGHLVKLPIALSESACREAGSAMNLRQSNLPDSTAALSRSR